MRRLREAIRQQRTELRKNESWILQHDNASAHTSMLMRECVIIHQPLYSPNLAPVDFFLFVKLKTPMKGKHFTMIEEIKGKSKRKLLAIPKSAFQKCFDDWKKRQRSTTFQICSKRS